LGPDCFKHTVEETDRFIDHRWVPIKRKVVKYSEPFAELGDRISFAIYSGRQCVGQDGEEYTVMNDTDITAKVTEGVIATSIEARKPFGHRHVVGLGAQRAFVRFLPHNAYKTPVQTECQCAEQSKL